MYQPTDIHTVVRQPSRADDERMNYQADDPVKNYERDARASAALAWTLSCDSYLCADAEASFRSRGYSRYVKSAVDPLLATDPALAGRGGPLESAFVGAVDRASLIGPLMDNGAIAMPLIPGAAQILLGTITGSSVSEEGAKPVVEAGLDVSGSPSKAVSQIVISAEAARAAAGAVLDGLRAALVSAVAAEVDRVIIAALTSGSPGAASADVGELLAAISGGQPRRPVVVAGFDVLGPIVETVGDWQALGVTIIPNPAAAGMMVVIDCAGLLLGDGGVQLAVARHASLSMDSTGAGNPTFSLFQKNAIALRAERFVNISVRPDAVAFASVGSP